MSYKSWDKSGNEEKEKEGTEGQMMHCKEKRWNERKRERSGWRKD